MRRDDAIRILRQEKNRLLREFGVSAIGIFGSTARDEASATSDVDIVVKLEKPDLFQLVTLRESLVAAFGTNVDLVHSHRYMGPKFRDRLEREAIYV